MSVDCVEEPAAAAVVLIAPAVRRLLSPGIRRRLEAIAPEFRRLVKDIKDRGDWDTAFVDALCDPPETFTFGGAIAHVVTFSAYRREMGIAALRTFGIKDIGYGDPIEWERAHANGSA